VDVRDRIEGVVDSDGKRATVGAERTGTFFHGFEKFGLGSGHWNEAGHKEAGKRIANFLCNTVESST
jgi:hypothetical protein